MHAEIILLVTAGFLFLIFLFLVVALATKPTEKNNGKPRKKVKEDLMEIKNQINGH